MKRTPGGQVNECISKKRYERALTLALKYWQEKPPLIRPETLLAAAYVANDVHWVTVGIRRLQDLRDYSDHPVQRRERLAMDMSPIELESPFSSWRLHAIAGDLLYCRSLAVNARMRAAELHPSPETYLPLVRSLANALQATHENRIQALGILKKAVGEFPSDMDLKWELAGTLLAIGDVDAAETVAESIDISSIVDNDENSRLYKQACFWAFIGEIKHALGKRAEALAAFKEALHLYPGYFTLDRDLPLEQWKIFRKLQGKEVK